MTDKEKDKIEIEEEPEKEEKAPEPEKEGAEAPKEEQKPSEKAEKEDKEDKKKRLKKLENEIESLKKQIEDKDKALEAEKDKYMRMYAEYDNFRRRSAKEREGVYADAYTDALKELLPILDNLDRAAQYKDAEAVSKGLEMIRKSMSEALSKLGVTEMECLGKTFDPNFHTAVMHEEDETKGEGEIVEVFQKGYVKGDKVIRYAMVKVAN